MICYKQDPRTLKWFSAISFHIYESPWQFASINGRMVEEWPGMYQNVWEQSDKIVIYWTAAWAVVEDLVPEVTSNHTMKGLPKFGEPHLLEGSTYELFSRTMEELNWIMSMSDWSVMIKKIQSFSCRKSTNICAVIETSRMNFISKRYNNPESNFCCWSLMIDGLIGTRQRNKIFLCPLSNSGVWLCVDCWYE